MESQKVYQSRSNKNYKLSRLHDQNFSLPTPTRVSGMKVSLCPMATLASKFGSPRWSTFCTNITGVLVCVSLLIYHHACGLKQSDSRRVALSSEIRRIVKNNFSIGDLDFFLYVTEINMQNCFDISIRIVIYLLDLHHFSLNRSLQKSESKNIAIAS